METLLHQIFLDYFVYGAEPPSAEYRQQNDIVSTLHDQVCTALGDEFSDELWYAHSQLALVEMWEAFQFGLHLARSF